MTITEFLEARIADDEAEANDQAGAEYFTEGAWPDGMAVRILAECASKRAIIKSLASTSAAHANETHLGQKLVLAGMDTGLRLALQALAFPYREHPDYQQEWAA